jgi:hypothetical protein
MEKLTPLIVPFEQILMRFFKSQAAHCFYIAQSPSAEQ